MYACARAFVYVDNVCHLCRTRKSSSAPTVNKVSSWSSYEVKGTAVVTALSTRIIRIQAQFYRTVLRRMPIPIRFVHITAQWKQTGHFCFFVLIMKMKIYFIHIENIICLFFI